MKIQFQIALASLIFVLASLGTADAQEVRTAGGRHTHSLTYHDRTPRVHIHGSRRHGG